MNCTHHFCNWFDSQFYVYFIKRFRELTELENKSTQFYLNKIFDNTLEANQLSKFLLKERSIDESE